MVARHAAADDSAEYVHLVFGSNAYNQGQGANIVDAEFLFLKGMFLFPERAVIDALGQAWSLLRVRYMSHTIDLFLCPQVTTLLT